VNKSRRIRCVVFVAHMVEWREGFGGGDLRERSHLEELGIDGKIILKMVFNK